VTDPSDMERVLGHLEQFRALHETEGITSLTGPGGVLWCLADIERLLALSAWALESCQSAAIAALAADGNPSACLPPALAALCEIYDSAAFWGSNVASRLRRVVSPCPVHSLAAA
jgi:hypothetical protein